MKKIINKRVINNGIKLSLKKIFLLTSEFIIKTARDNRDERTNQIKRGRLIARNDF